ncbi:hypothetical protein AYO47_04795 [Planctomyces sp. SCGC AG-212-M04]|nr:hypothetical protein AYO47_04795 [Planctomyces sp. SCGC AG-212-M04]
MTNKYQEFRVVLRHIKHSHSGNAGPEFVAIVSGRDEMDAQVEAEKLVETLHRLVSIVSIEPRPDDDRNGWA